MTSLLLSAGLWPRDNRPWSARMGALATSVTATSSRECSVSRPCNTVRATIRVYKEWPTPDERVRLADLVTAAKAVAHATLRLCS